MHKPKLIVLLHSECANGVYWGHQWATGLTIFLVWMDTTLSQTPVSRVWCYKIVSFHSYAPFFSNTIFFCSHLPQWVLACALSLLLCAGVESHILQTPDEQKEEAKEEDEVQWWIYDGIWGDFYILLWQHKTEVEMTHFPVARVMKWRMVFACVGDILSRRADVWCSGQVPVWSLTVWLCSFLLWGTWGGVGLGVILAMRYMHGWVGCSLEPHSNSCYEVQEEDRQLQRIKWVAFFGGSTVVLQLVW